MRYRSAAPCDDSGVELGHDDSGPAGEHIERRAEREAETETADEHARALDVAYGRAAKLCYGDLAPVHKAAHEHPAAHADHEVAFVTLP
jgi:hypothetical protein